MADEKQIKNCAIYTRKSNEDGMDGFSSLDSQRESAENYIRSQKHSGWVILPEHYDDGGYSGGNMERPALKRLLADVEAGKIDIILLYKMDRLSRSLLDFMKLTEILEQHNVSFVSVTQDINTSTSSGRMMLNILMTFGQFEREIVTERIRDSIAGAKRRGKYCGGVPPLGYDANPETKKLEINLKEAAIVREAFELYVKLGSGQDVIRILNEKGYRTMGWTSHKGRCHENKEFTPDSLYRLLNNAVYSGQVHHKGAFYAGEHKAIITPELWERSRQLLKKNAPVPAGVKRNSIASPFKGLLQCGYCGGSFGISYSQKNEHRYMYYICIKDEDRAERQCPLSRVPAGDLDRVILQQMSRIFKTPSMLVQAYSEVQKVEMKQKTALIARQQELEEKQKSIREKMNNSDKLAELREQFMEVNQLLNEVKSQLSGFGREFSSLDLVETCGSIETVWAELFPVERYRLAHLLFDRIILYADRIMLDVKTLGLKSLMRELKADESVTVSVLDDGQQKDVIRLTVPVVIRRRDRRKIIILPGESVDDTDSGGKVNEPGTLAQHLARAHAWMEILESGKVATVTKLAEKLNLDRSYVNKTLKLVNLSPEIQKTILEGKEPDSLTLKRLRHEIPDDWEEQKKVLLG